MSEPLDLERPFFSRDETKRYIDVVAHLPSLVLYAGAGVSIDRTGLDWRALAVHLLTSKDHGTDDRNAASLVEKLGPHRAGSVIAQRFADDKKAIAKRLSEQLYRNQGILAGRLVRTIAELWLDLVAQGKVVKILTSNYDEHIELAIRDWISTSEDLFKARALTMPPLPPADAWVEHLHGTIPENGAVTDPPVISERDYLLAEKNSEKLLTETFKEHDVLIVGSGLQDTPLLNALLRTADDARARGVHRMALVARSDMSAEGLSPESLSSIHAHEQRLAQFGLEGIYYDHHSQAAQFLGEVRLAMPLKPGQYIESQEHRYGRRLRNWWDRWSKKNISTKKNFKSRQTTHHDRLLAALESLKSELGAPNEKMKIELWFRWDPEVEPKRRQLKLWASSYSRFSNYEMTREVAIEPNSKYAVVRAFSSGRIEYEPARVDPEPTPHALAQADRWKTYVALPLEAKGRPNLVVGGIVVASGAPPRQSCLSVERRAEHEGAVGPLIALGLELAAS